MNAELQETIEERLRDFDPDVELVAFQQPSGTLRIFIDRPGGVDLSLCEAVTKELSDLTERWSLEVSSPGAERPLTKPEHFRRFIGRRARVRTMEPIEGQRNFTGTLAEADDETVTVEADDTAVRIPFARVERSNLLGDIQMSDGGKS